VKERTDYYEFVSGDYGDRQFRIDYTADWVEVSWVADDGNDTHGFKLSIDNENGLVSCLEHTGIECDMVAMVGLIIDLEVRGELVDE